MQCRTVSFDLEELAADLVLRGKSVGCELDEVRLLGVESFELLGELLLERPCGGLVVTHRFTEGRSNEFDEVSVEPDRPVVLGHGGFDVVDVEVWLVTGSVLSASTEEVVVDAASSLGSLEHHPAFDSGLVAGAAPQQPFERMVVLAGSFAA
ncbi:MAG: hypothetical protein QNJ12_11550 [Ilumatobacter sp.]|nr:hypothetical protein [Ilumatobacter sp.]MDJ0769425.1 hypothetical protein [Ilumatobacter sp.]